MKPMLKNLAVSALFVALCGGTAIAQDQHDDQQEHRDQDHRDQDRHAQYVRHDEWKKGERIRHEDWDRGQRVDDWQTHHLRRPPKGYEWRDIDGQYVLANPDGVIHQIVVPHSR